MGDLFANNTGIIIPFAEELLAKDGVEGLLFPFSLGNTAREGTVQGRDEPLDGSVETLLSVVWFANSTQLGSKTKKLNSPFHNPSSSPSLSLFRNTYKSRLISPEWAIDKHEYTGFFARLWLITYEYSNNEMGANKKEGQVKLERSPVKEAKVFKKEEKLPCWSAGILSRVLSEEVILRKNKI